MRNRLLVAGAISLAGCATTNQVIERPPVMTETSALPIETLQECISLALSMLTPPHIIPQGENTLMAFTVNGTAIATVTLSPGTPNLIEVRQGLALNKRYRDRIRRCAATGNWKPQ